MQQNNDKFKLSLSKAKTFESCAAKYKFSYIEKLPKKEFEFHSFGKLVHQVLEDFHRAYLNGSTDPFNRTMSIAYKKALKEFKDKLSKESVDEAYSIINSYLKNIYENPQQVKNIIDVEKKFDIEIYPNIILNGAIDRIQVDDDGCVHVCDYKTSKNSKYLENDFFQLLTYAYVLLQDNPSLQSIKGSYIMMRKNFEYITVSFNKEQILAVKDKYKNYYDNIMAEKKWETNPTKLCSYCDFLSSCKEGQKFVAPNTTKYGERKWE